jgi:low molecular weight phosphotyrosine protein phosphatase
MVRAKNIAHDWVIDSAGTAGYHVGDSPDERTVSTCQKFLGHKIKVDFQARQVTKHDFTKFDYILCMDESNLRDLTSIRPKNATATLKLLGDFDPKGDRIIKDPYYGGMNGFETNFNQVTRSLEALLQHVADESTDSH